MDNILIFLLVMKTNKDDQSCWCKDIN